MWEHDQEESLESKEGCNEWRRTKSWGRTVGKYEHNILHACVKYMIKNLINLD